MTARPILFSGPMVRALLDGTKTQTRRIIKPRLLDNMEEPHESGSTFFHSDRCGGACDYACRGQWWEDVCPYGKRGDRLWVRETWSPVPTTAYAHSDGVQQTINPADRWTAAVYKAGWERSEPTWKPSIHMPRWASRITLEITDVRVQRLQEISAGDALAEGCVYTDTNQHMWEVIGCPGTGEWTAYQCYRKLWESINGTGSWGANPWVWALTFKRRFDRIATAAEIKALRGGP
jgi:hypothetical protein